MQIKNLLNKLDKYQTTLDKADNKPSGKSRKTADSASAGGGDRVSLSNTARLRTEAYSGALSAPEVRQEKVEAIKQKVDSGEYQVDSKDIARKLLKDESDFFV